MLGVLEVEVLEVEMLEVEMLEMLEMLGGLLEMLGVLEVEMLEVLEMEMLEMEMLEVEMLEVEMLGLLEMLEMLGVLGGVGDVGDVRGQVHGRRLVQQSVVGAHGVELLPGVSDGAGPVDFGAGGSPNSRSFPCHHQAAVLLVLCVQGPLTHRGGVRGPGEV
ncbi:hypothetical protein CesoFtcFv8_005527 [Champsocephalus esox]|uniref:Uncharacterized protein n=1 Tax=Champsocephalus esox TaxID=159716 RepID=A0AAN8CV75_9TELE|nr:hypothetical protein CesoFtcFv8_005527 [Champsocephalus esox]